MSELQGTVAILLRPVALMLQRAGIDPEPVFARHGLSVADTGNPQAFIEAEASTGLLTDVEALMNDASIGIRAARLGEYSTFGGLGVALAAGGSVMSVLQRITRFHRLISDVVTSELSEDDQFIAIHFTSRGDHSPHPQAILFVMACIVRLLRLRISPTLNPAKVAGPFVSEEFSAAITRYFRAPIETAQHFSLFFDRDSARMTLQSSDTQLAAMLDATLNQRLAEVEKGSLVVQLSLWVEEGLPEGEPSLGDAAKKFNLSVRSLQRRLSEEELTWKQLIENTRKTLVERHLRTPGMSVTQLAFLLGFSDVSSFSRAFKKWYGVAPSQFK
ncbi:MAG: AraC family transcriptional regulator ligand-binding domain-containing protein [Alcanivoracaceae bacterium]|nr:AraC family transcriptional regulator ligand-binding domain-containing protein [Alcanivoracaceae bacterium]